MMLSSDIDFHGLFILLISFMMIFFADCFSPASSADFRYAAFFRRFDCFSLFLLSTLDTCHAMIITIDAAPMPLLPHIIATLLAADFRRYAMFRCRCRF